MRQRRIRQTAVSTDTFILLCRSELGIDVIREYRFHPTRKWRFDYAVPSYRIALEVEGGVWVQGRHTRPQGFLGDIEKYNTATLMGWRLIRTTPCELMTKKTLGMIRFLMQN